MKRNQGHIMYVYTMISSMFKKKKKEHRTNDWKCAIMLTVVIFLLLKFYLKFFPFKNRFLKNLSAYLS